MLFFIGGNMKRAKIIVIEGTDGSGKETQSKKTLRQSSSMP